MTKLLKAYQTEIDNYPNAQIVVLTREETLDLLEKIVKDFNIPKERKVVVWFDKTKASKAGYYAKLNGISFPDPVQLYHIAHEFAHHLDVTRKFTSGEDVPKYYKWHGKSFLLCLDEVYAFISNFYKVN
ncbi:MAG: hypothetical protein WC375_12735 [Methanomassiliicoccales archaeon]|jgi:hypothetical protein